VNSKYRWLCLTALAIILSCKTAEFNLKVVDINGMIYDFSNRPIAYCEISLGENHNTSTDINGRFTLHKVPFGEYTITGQKKGFETYISEIYIKDNSQIIYIRMPSQSQLLEMVDEALVGNNFADADALLGRAYQIDQNNVEMLFYYATLKFRQREYDKAISFLETAQRLGSQDIYVGRFLNVLKELKNADKTN